MAKRSGSGVRPEPQRKEASVREPAKTFPCAGSTELFYGPFGNGPGGAFSTKKGRYKFKFKSSARYEGPQERKAREAKCIAICLSCPFREPCLETALVFKEEWGVWGGWTEHDRREFRSWCAKWGYEDVPFFPDLKEWIEAFVTDVHGNRRLAERHRVDSGPSFLNHYNKKDKKSKVAKSRNVQRQQAKPKRKAR